LPASPRAEGLIELQPLVVIAAQHAEFIEPGVVRGRNPAGTSRVGNPAKLFAGTPGGLGASLSLASALASASAEAALAEAICCGVNDGERPSQSVSKPSTPPPRQRRMPQRLRVKRAPPVDF